MVNQTNNKLESKSVKRLNTEILVKLCGWNIFELIFKNTMGVIWAIGIFNKEKHMSQRTPLRGEIMPQKYITHSIATNVFSTGKKQLKLKAELSR